MRPSFLYAALTIAALAGAAGCTPSIGDKCTLSTDCSLQGDRLCDTSQPGGYCTVVDCRPNLCPDKAACVLFNPTLQGCAYDDRTPSRTGRSFCLAQCQSDSDCRSGYICADPRSAPWGAVILDDVQSQRVCIVPASGSVPASSAPPPVCQSTAPDAGALTDAGADAALDAETDGSDAEVPDAGDAGPVDAAGD